MFVLDYALPNCLALDRANKEWARFPRPPFYFFKIASVKQIPAPNHSIVIGSPETRGLRLILEPHGVPCAREIGGTLQYPPQS